MKIGKLYLLFYALMSLVVGLVLQWRCAIDFLYAEQFRLFRWSGDYVLPFFGKAGGIVGLLDSFTLQFFAFPWGGALLTTLMFVLMATGTDRLLRSVAPRLPLPIVGLVVGLMQVGLATETYYSLEQTWAQILMVWALVPFAACRRQRCVWGVVIALWLYYATGITALLAIVLMAVIASRDSEGRAATLGALGASLLAIVAHIYSTNYNAASHVWTLSAYYYDFSEAPQHSYFVPAALAAGLLAAVVWRDRALTRRRPTILAVQIVAGLLLGGWYVLLCHGWETSRVKRLEVMRWQHDWAGILAEDMPSGSIPLYANYQNLALAATGHLADELMERSQCGTTGLQLVWQGTQQESDLLCDIFMQQGHVAMAQKMAFTAMQGNREQIHGRLMLRLIETNLILQADGVAEKYINILSQTLRYRAEAEAYRKFVGHPELVAADSRMGELQRCTRGCDWCPNDLEKGLKQIVEANPSYRNALEYLGCYYMLQSDPTAFKTFLDTYHAYPGLEPMPRSFERAAQTLFWHKPGKEETR